MRWVKLHTTLHHHIAFRRLTPGARLVFYVCLEIAGDLEQDGALVVRGGGPLTVAEIALEVGIKEPQAQAGLEALMAIGFMTRRADKAFVIERWAEKTEPEDRTAAERKRRQRDKSRVTPTVTDRDTSRVHTRSREEEVEGEVDSVPTGTGAEQASAPWPEEVRDGVKTLRDRELRTLTPDERGLVARYHALEFGNCTQSKSRNLSRATAIATGIANLTDRLSRNPAKADLTVAEYVGLARRIHERGNRVPWFRPMDVEAEIELVTA